MANRHGQFLRPNVLRTKCIPLQFGSTLFLLHQQLSARQHLLPPASVRNVSTSKKLSSEQAIAASPKGPSKLGTLPLTWPHHGWPEKVLLDVVPSHRKPRTLGDHFAWRVTRICRWAMDFITGMGPEQKVDGKHPTTALSAQKPLTERQWLIRFIFLESIAGVPGMVAGTLRHLRSIRRFQPDQGWVKTLLEESYNERMHLLTFLELYKPGPLMRLFVFAAQGVFYNAMFVSYLVSPKICHRFVGYLEEEAVHTYTRCLREIDEGRLPGWAVTSGGGGKKVPDVAVQYWGMGEGRRTMRDLILYIRADEASHRGVNHTLGNLHQTSDPNPFIDGYNHMDRKQISVTRPAGLEREEVIIQRHS